jgi:basic membrane protein A and related proteins
MVWSRISLLLSCCILTMVACSSTDEAPTGGGTAGTAGTAGSSAGQAGSSGAGGVAEGKVCLMTDIVGDFDDKSYVATAFSGLEQAKAMYNWKIFSAEASTFSSAAFKERLTQLTSEKCNLIVTVSAIFTNETTEVAKEHPEQKIQALDFTPEPSVSNIWGQGYQIHQATFMAGYVAASVTKTKKVGTFAGLNIPPLLEFMNGFALGVAHYNMKHQDNVEMLGWDLNSQTGTDSTFIGGFNDETKGQAAAKQLYDAGADIVFPVAGRASYGAATEAKIRNNVFVIGVDVDWGLQADIKSVVLTSVLKRLDISVLNAVQAVGTQSFTGGNRQGNLENNQVDIAPFHDLDTLVPQSIKDELPQLRKDIIAGTVKTVPLIQLSVSLAISVTNSALPIGCAPSVPTYAYPIRAVQAPT